MATKKFIYGIAVVKFNQKEIGYIEKGSWDWGGTKPESTDIEAEQVPDAPVLTLMTGRGFDAELPAQTVDLGYPTIYGPLHGVFASQLRYTLPVTEAPRTAFPQNPEANPDDAQQLITKTISQIDGIRFRLFCENIARSWHSLCPAIDRPPKAWSWLPEEFRDYLRGLYRSRIPFLSSYRDYRFGRSLCEPYSGAKYFYSFSISTQDPGDVGVFGVTALTAAYTGGEEWLDQLICYIKGNYDSLRDFLASNIPQIQEFF